MRQALRLHPESTCFAVTHIDVEVLRPQPHNLTFTYVVTGTIGDLAVPSANASTRTDELWRHTCFEAFIGSSQSVAYYEFNFAPSSPECCVLQASLNLGQPLFSRGSTLRVGLSAVIEEINGHRSYWALAHPPGNADFHHSDCFALELA